MDFAQLHGVLEEIVRHPLLIVVDDDPALCETLWDLLHDHAYRVCIANSLDGARRRLEERRYDVAVLDLRLPEAGGTRSVGLVRRMNPHAKTLVITGHAEELTEGEASRPDAVCYKPFDPHRLVGEIDRLAGRSA